MMGGMGGGLGQMAGGILGGGVSMLGIGLQALEAEDKLAKAKEARSKLQTVDLAQSYAKATAGNVGNLPGIEDLARKTDVFTQEQYDKAFKAAVPEAEELNKQIVANLKSGLKYELPEAEREYLQRQSAAYGIESGTKGSQ